MRRRASSSALNIWPGFVDALSSLLIIIIFLLTLFALAHVTASALIERRDEALDRLRTQLSELSEVLRLEKQTSADLRRSLSEMSASLQATQTERDRLRSERGDLEARLNAATGALSSEQELSGKQRDEIAELNNAISAMRDQMARLEALLSDAEAKAKADQVQIADLGKRLNVALAGRVEELARYRSEFFGRLREVLGNRPDIRIVGDRFVFQSEVLFPSGSADLNPDGRKQIDSLAETLKEISAKIPKEINWVLRVDGHTDKVPISTPEFPSNWELSTARAIAVVKVLIADGIPPDRLAAAGFGEYQPLDPADTPEAYRRNRRIELKLDQR
jgi:chemotaxis protein MotB